MRLGAGGTLLPVALAGVVAIVTGVVVLVGFGRDGGAAGSAPAAQRAAALAGTTAAATPATATTSATATAAPAPVAASTAPLPKPSCPALAAALDEADAGLARLIGEDAPGPGDTIPGAGALAAFARQLDRLEASAPGEIRDQVQALVLLQLSPLASLTVKSGEQAFADALSGLADAVQSGEYLDASDAIRTWIASHCG